MAFFEFLAALLLGVLAGIFTGLTPGIHVNLVSLLVVSSSAYLLGIFSLPSLGVFIISMAIAHTFLDILPAIFLGAPNEATALGVLPGHKLLLQGMGYEAVKLTVIGSLSSLILAILLFPLLIIIFPLIYDDIRPYIGFILIAVVIYMILIEKGLDKKFWSSVVFLVSGILGILALTMPNLKQPLFPLLSGLFGLSMLIVSLSQKVQIPRQRITENIVLSKFQSAKSILAGTFSGSIVSFFPGMGPAQAAVIGSNIFGSLGTYAFLILIGSIGTVDMVISMVTFYTLDRARNGAIFAIQELLSKIDLSMLILFIATALIAAGLATFLVLFLARVFARLIEKVNYSVLCFSIIIFITLMVFYFSSWVGLLILAVSTAIGIIPNVVDVKRSHSMGCLMLPVILFFVL
ncbi:tripartite tricarboxylate transporter permease [Candidatus Woesearchaeota archaeon]|nr:tripartite tricarboxylate transporter permease [Candidatus Woesearchaeota archaeon]